MLSPQLVVTVGEVQSFSPEVPEADEKSLKYTAAYRTGFNAHAA
jgi:hypothetical protein